DTYNIFANDPQHIGPDPSVSGLLNKEPLPNDFGLGTALNTGGFDWNPPSQCKGPNVFGRIDHTFSQSDNIFGHFLIGTYNTTQGDFLNARPEVFPGFPPLGEVNRDNSNLAVKWAHTFTPTLVNEFVLGYNRFKFLFTFGESNPGFPDPTKNPPWADDCVVGSTTNVDSSFCGSAHTARAVTTPQFIDNVSWVHGAHNLRLGINFRFYRHNDSRGFFGGNIVDPIISFRRTLRTAGLLNLPAGSGASAPSATDLNTIQQAAVELLGIPGRLQQAFPADFVNNTYGTGLETVYTRAHQYDSYVQDEWRVRPNITVNAGLRWEFNPPPFDNRATLVPNGDITSGNPVSFVKADGWYKNNNLGSVGPRMGIAYSPDNKTSIRAGYGWMFDTISTFQVTAMAGKVPGFALNCVDQINTAGTVTTSAGCVAPAGLGNRIASGFPVSMPGPSITPSAALTQPAYQPSGVAPSVGAFDPNLKNPSIHEWSLTVQRELPSNFVTEIGYVGKRGTHLYRAYDLNQINPNPAFLGSFLTARQNVFNGCKPDGTGCPTGVTGQAPTLLLQLAPASTLNNNTNDFLQNNVGDLATQIDQGNIVTRGFPGNYFRPDPQFTQIFFQDAGGDSYYHGAFVGVRRRFEQGLTFGLSYTFSKSIDDQSIDPVGAATGGGLSVTNSVTPTDIHNFALDRARSDFDNRHVLTVDALYEFPFGNGKRLASNIPKWLDVIVGGWSYTGIFDYQSGEPYTLYSGAQTANTEHVSTALIEGPFDSGHLQTVQGIEGPVMYNVGALITNPADPHFDCRNETGTQTYFCIPQPGQQGSGRNTAQGPNFWNLDSGLLKDFKVTERVKLQFRAEAFNVLNHPNFNNPRNASSGTPRVNNSLFAETCCSTTSLPSSATVIAIGEPNRVLQFGLKVVF
ncbi:MAG: TonB-dependent receptor, partial [Acidobacteria bacterium]|nr:TonB-dependent receptor [Acidobacteriota bacterium]